MRRFCKKTPSKRLKSWSSRASQSPVYSYQANQSKTNKHASKLSIVVWSVQANVLRTDYQVPSLLRNSLYLNFRVFSVNTDFYATAIFSKKGRRGIYYHIHGYRTKQRCQKYKSQAKHYKTKQVAKQVGSGKQAKESQQKEASMQAKLIVAVRYN